MYVKQPSLASLSHLLALHDDLPAFRAGYLAMVVLIAALLNLGVFAMLLGLLVVLDYVKYRTRGYSFRLTMRAVARENLLDFALFSIAFVASFTFHHGSGIIVVSGLLRYQESLLRGIAVTAAKSAILFHALRVLRHFSVEPMLTRSEIRSPWTPWECVAAMVMGFALLPLFALSILPSDLSSLSASVVDVMLPWKL